MWVICQVHAGTLEDFLPPEEPLLGAAFRLRKNRREAVIPWDSVLLFEHHGKEQAG